MEIFFVADDQKRLTQWVAKEKKERLRVDSLIQDISTHVLTSNSVVRNTEEWKTPFFQVKWLKLSIMD